MKKFPLTVICLLLAFVTTLRTALPGAPLDPAKFAKPIRVVCVGDSITQGVGADQGKSYPEQLQELLGDKWNVGNFGVSARTLLRKGDFPYMNEKAFEFAQKFNPDAVIIMLGTNDTKPQNWAHKNEFIKDYTELVTTFLDLPSKPRVFICRPTPGHFGADNNDLKDQIKMIDRVIAEQRATLIDMYAALDKHPEMLPDHVHPNTAGAGVMAQTAYDVLTGKRLEPPTK